MSLQSLLQYRKLQREVRQSLHLSDRERNATLPSGNPTPGLNLPPYLPDNTTTILTNFTDDDDNNPQKWSTSKKIFVTALVLTAGLPGGWASANDSMVLPQIQTAFGASSTVASLSVALFLIAFGIGSLFTGPFSETVGRNPVYLTSLVSLMVSLAIAGAAPNIETHLVFRFVAGLSGCASITTGGGTMADLWSPLERGFVFSMWSMINFCFVFVAPGVSGYIGESPHISWRWSDWVPLVMAGISFLLVFLLAAETHAPTILSWKARILNKETGDWRHRSEHQLNSETLSRRLLRSTWRPFHMLIHEPPVLLFTLYLTVLYIVAFTFLTGYTFIYSDIYHLSQGKVGLCFLGLDVGMCICMAMVLPLLTRYVHNLRKVEECGLSGLPPEDRLWIAIITAPLLPIGLFWMAWTASPSISCWCSLAGSALIGVAFLGALVASYLYLIDAFEGAAASALSVAACVRYVAAGVMIPVSIPMYENLGVDWTLTLLGCLGLILTPAPFVIWKFGPRLQRKGHPGKGVDANEKRGDTEEKHSTV